MRCAIGRFLTASATQHADLFWGVRGGGGNFGVVTSLAFQVHPVGTVLGGLVMHPVTRAFWGAMQPFLAKAVYVNYTSDEGEDVIQAAYAANVHERLVALKNTYDPTNFFRLNQNIKPTV